MGTGDDNPLCCKDHHYIKYKRTIIKHIPYKLKLNNTVDQGECPWEIFIIVAQKLHQ